MAALATAPLAGADEYGGGGAGNPCCRAAETTGGSAVIGGQETDCASPGNSQLTATPNDLGIMGEEAGRTHVGMFGW